MFAPKYFSPKYWASKYWGTRSVVVEYLHELAVALKLRGSGGEGLELPSATNNIVELPGDEIPIVSLTGGGGMRVELRGALRSPVVLLGEEEVSL